MFQAPALAENPGKFQRITQIPRSSPTQSANYAKFAHLLTYSILCFRHLLRQRTLENSSELCKFHAVRPHSPRITQNSHICLLILYYVSGTCSGKEPWKIPANYANSAQFAHTVRELRKIRTFVNLSYIMFQAPAPAENPGKIQRITQIPHDLPTQPANHVNSAHFAL